MEPQTIICNNGDCAVRSEEVVTLETNANSSTNSSISLDSEQNEKNLHKSLDLLSDDIKEKLKEFPEVLMYIENLQRIIQKQLKKILKWKTKVRNLTEKRHCDISTQTCFDDTEVHTSAVGVYMENQEDTKGKKSFTENIRQAAEEAVQSSGFVYEETSGLYYDYNSGYYYNAEYGLYYDGTTGTYLKYNQETQSYEFHSQVVSSDIVTTESGVKCKPKRRIKKGKEEKESKKPRRNHESDSKEIEEGECSDSSISSDGDSSVSVSSDICKQWPPCMRMIVESTEIPKIKVGSLFVITCDGGTIGREGNHSICLPDINVSKHHLKISYNKDISKYEIVDLGSRNGTILNGKRVSSSKQESEPIEVRHGSKLQLGSTTLLCHIHEGTQTCGHCEPGLLIEEEKDPPPALKSKTNINQQFKSELRRLRKHHGFLGSSEESSKLAEGYTDRAEKRRVEIGSQNPYEKTESASLDESISSENKGFKLLSKMGWKEGQSLGKDGTGVKEPVKLVQNTGKVGIGAEVVSIPDVPKCSKQSIWKKTQDRFEKLPTKVVFDEDSDS